MGANVSLPRESFENFKCYKCLKYLTVSPISGTKGSYTCGRCEPNNPSNELYEEIAQYIIFPCSYKNCKEQLPWGSIGLHEQNCIHKKTKCPIPECKQFIKIKNAHSHFNTDHKALMYENKISSSYLKLRDMPSQNTFRYYVSYKNYEFFATALIEEIQESNQILYECGFTVFTYQEISENIKYMVTIHTTFSEDSKTLQKMNQEIKYHSDDEHSFPDKVPPVTKFKNFSPRTSLQYTIEIYESTNTPPPIADDVNNEIINTIECPICQEFMLGHIYNCTAGHSICNNCTKSIKQCPFCRARMTNSRNYVLEDLVMKTKIGCWKKPMGCTYMGTIQTIKDHEKRCNY